MLSWWRALCALALLNVCLWLAVWYFGPVSGVHGGLQLTLSGIYVAVCAYRSVLPRVDLERLVVVDTHLSSIFLGRAAATVAEIFFALQLGLLVHQLGVHAGMPSVQKAAWAVPMFMVVAQGFCWHSVLTLNHITQAVESLLWAAGFSWMAALLASSPSTAAARSMCWRSSASSARWLSWATSWPWTRQCTGAATAMPARTGKVHATGPGCTRRLAAPRAQRQLGRMEGRCAVADALLQLRRLGQHRDGFRFRRLNPRGLRKQVPLPRRAQSSRCRALRG